MSRKKISIFDKRNEKNIRKWIFLPGSIAAVCAFAVFMANRGGHNTSSFWNTHSEKETVSDDITTTSYRYEQEFFYTLRHYSTLRKYYFADYSTAIPGLENTCFGTSDSDQMVPQGICIAGDYMLISAYDKSGMENSVLYVLSNEDAANRKLLTTIVLPDKNHVGGIAYDGSSLWVAKSTSKRLSEITYEHIAEAVFSGRSVYELEEYDGEFNCGVTASFVSYQDGRLWVGTSHSFVNRQGLLTVFRQTEENETGGKEDNQEKWVRQFTLEIPDYAQGVAFFSESGTDYLLLSTSHGRFQSSCLYLYEETINDERVVLSPKAKFEMPPMAEELISDGAYTYCLFESAATCYSIGEGFRCEYPVDRVCALVNQLLAESAE
ncbi:MAG: hypothetical protein LUE19_04435 [Clostridiales bacterium]|nr:hypothetical protein [Clostridiales bacterium]